MKNFIVFISGFVTGVLVLFLVLYVNNLSKQSDEGLPGLTLFAEKGECIISKGKIKVFQVLEPNIALAITVNMELENAKSYEQVLEWKHGIVVLLINYEGKSYYDDQIIDISANKCARQIGTYQYTTKQDDFEKTEWKKIFQDSFFEVNVSSKINSSNLFNKE